MICPKCKSIKQNIVDSRREGNCVKRRRECFSCGYRFSTTEIQNEKLRQIEKDMGILQEKLARAREILE